MQRDQLDKRKRLVWKDLEKGLPQAGGHFGIHVGEAGQEPRQFEESATDRCVSALARGEDISRPQAKRCGRHQRQH